MGEAVKQLIPLPSTGSDCPYALVQFNRDAHHMLLPKEGQLSRELHPKEVGASGPGHTFAHQPGRFLQASGHIIPGECP